MSINAIQFEAIRSRSEKGQATNEDCVLLVEKVEVGSVAQKELFDTVETAIEDALSDVSVDSIMRDIKRTLPRL